MFQPFEGTPNYPELERSILKLWDEHNTFQKRRDLNAEGARWEFQDGPITANNRMGVHHAWGRTYKDIFNRYHAMRGHRLRWQNGFDCQGLWVEVEVEKALGFKGKPDILHFGLEEFSRACRARVDKFAAEITGQSKRLGQWMDWERSYYTFDDSNIEHIWGFLKKCHTEGWLAQDYRVMPWCPRCETSLSQHESADSYKNVTHRSVYVKLPIQLSEVGGHSSVKDGDKFLVWTTTPWTLTANVAVALNPALTYVRAQSGDDVLVLSRETAKTALRPGYEILEEISGADLVGLNYSGPLDDLPLQVEMNAATPRRSVAWEDVGEAEGTGIVHIAPGCGAEDFLLGQREGLGFLVPVDQSAHFVSATGEFAGKHALENVDDIFAALEARGRLYRSQRYEHSYPHCWRCDHELIFNAVQEWFIKADAGERPARARLRRAAGEVEWIPDYAGKRMDDWLANMGDWCISRKRFWGLPLPFYLDSETGEVEVIGTRAELRDRAVDPAMVDALPELHRPWIDEIQIRSRDGKRTLRRVPEVGDAWLDAGIVPFSTVGYNRADDVRMPEIRREAAEWQPVDFITEMREQVRLWFFSMLFMSVALEDRAPYKTAMVYETMLDENGDRISKTKKNGVPYDEAVDTVGADPMRWTFCGNTLTKDIRFGYKPIHESARRLLTLWNVYGFFVTYANLDKPELSTVEIRVPTEGRADTSNPLDRWILARLQQVIADVTRALETYEPALATRTLEAFIEELSTWYVRRSRRRFWKSDSDEDKAAAYSTLHHILLETTKLLAPIIPFTAEAMYANLRAPLPNAPESVHLCEWPQVQETLRDDALIAQVAGVQQAVSLGHAARKDSKIKVRQPLARVMIQAPTPDMRVAIEGWRETILEELNVKSLELLDDAGDLVTYSLKANLPKLGKKLGKQMGAVRGLLENASPADARCWGEAARAGQNVSLELDGQTLELAPDEILVTTQQSGEVSFAEENGWAVALDTALTPDLLSEGHARDFIRAIQSARKDAGLEVSDKIAIIVANNTGAAFDAMLENFGDLVQDETLAEELRLVDANYPKLADIALGDEVVRFRVEKLTAPVLDDEAESNEAAL